jgi:phospholipase/carboxylesterase
LKLESVGLDLRLREPNGAPGGALILNHGRGTDENDLFGLLEAIDPDRRLLGVTTGAPLVGLAPGGRHWYVVERVGFPHERTFAESNRALAARLDELLAERGIAWSQVALGGFSQGAVMAYAVGLGPGRPSPAALLCLSAFIPTVAGWEPELGDRQGLRAFIHHGANDPVIGVEFGRAARDRLQAAEIDVDYRETPAGHWVPPEIIPAMRATIAAALGAESGLEA